MTLRLALQEPKGARQYRTNVLSWIRATRRRNVSSESRGNRPTQPGRRPDEDRRDAHARGSPHPRPPPGGVGGEQPVTTIFDPGASPGIWRGQAQCQPSTGRTPGERADDMRKDPVASGGDGVLSRLSTIEPCVDRRRSRRWSWL